MTPLLWFLAGLCLGAFLGVVIMALLVSASDADRFEAELQEWDVPLVTDAERREALATYDGLPITMDEAELDLTDMRHVRVRRGPYNWQDEGL